MHAVKIGSKRGIKKCGNAEIFISRVYILPCAHKYFETRMTQLVPPRREIKLIFMDFLINKLAIKKIIFEKQI